MKKVYGVFNAKFYFILFYFGVFLFSFSVVEYGFLYQSLVEIHFPGLPDRNGRTYQVSTDGQVSGTDTDIRHVSAGSKSRLSVDIQALGVKSTRCQDRLFLLAISTDSTSNAPSRHAFQLSTDGDFLVLGARDVRAFIFDRCACWIRSWRFCGDGSVWRVQVYRSVSMSVLCV